MSRVWTVALAAGSLGLAACSDSGSGLNVPAKYEFESRFVPGESSVSYTGQICRHVLISALTAAVRDAGAISGDEYRGDSVPYFDNTIAGALAAQSPAQFLSIPEGLSLPADQDSLGELCGSKHLKEKFAGNDTATDHRDWNSEFAGIQGESNAEAYLRRLLQEVSEQAEQGTQAPGAPHYVSPEGIDYAQMIQKLLLGAVAFSQAADDYLDDDVSGKGLLTSNQRDGNNPFSRLEHQFDEGYGYFGAARAYGDRSDAVNRTGVVDDNGDGILDLTSEHNFGASTNAAKRDEGSDPGARTDFTGEAFLALRRGRAILAAAEVDFADLSPGRQDDLLAARDAAVAAWEAAIAATVVHYINDTLDELAKVDTPDFSIAELAKVYSEMKAFALGLQFNPRSPLHAAIGDGSGESKFARLHSLMRDQPPCSAGVCVNDPQYRDGLLAARDLMGEAYGFAEVNLEVW